MVQQERDKLDDLRQRLALLDERLVLNATGPTTVRLLPPLTISARDVEDALARLARALGA